MPIQEVILTSEAERVSPPVEPIIGVQACGKRLILLTIGDAPESGHTGFERERSICIEWASLEAAWRAVRDDATPIPADA